MKTRLSIISFVILSAMLFSPLTVHAASASIAPATASHEINSSFSVSLYASSDPDVMDTVQASLTYDSSLLQFVSITVPTSTTNGHQIFCPDKTGGSGSILVTCAALSGYPAGSQLVATITFKTIAGSGTASVPANISLVSGGTDIGSVSATGTYTLTTPSNNSNTGGSSGSSSGSTSHSSSTTSSTAQSTASQSTSASDSSDQTASTTAEDEAGDTLAATDTKATTLIAEENSTATNHFGSWLLVVVTLVAAAALAVFSVQGETMLAKVKTVQTKIKQLVK